MKKKLFIGLFIGSMVLGMAACQGSGTGNTTGAAASTSQESDTSMSGEISVISREEGSGTRGAFVELFGVEEEDVDNTTENAQITNNTSVMMTNVSGDPQAIGYLSLGSLDDTVVKPLKVDGAEATAENVKNGEYQVSRPFQIAAKEDVSEEAQDFMDYIMSAEGQKIIEDNGYIAANGNPEEYAGGGVSGKVVVAGSSSVTPVMEKLKEGYEGINTGAEIEIQQSDSTTGMESAISGVCDIGMASRALKDSEVEAGLTGTEIARDGIAVIVNLDNPITDITSEQVKEIYTGAVTDWADLQ